jgi:ribosomal protein L37AE/L43A
MGRTLESFDRTENTQETPASLVESNICAICRLSKDKTFLLVCTQCGVLFCKDCDSKVEKREFYPSDHYFRLEYDYPLCESCYLKSFAEQRQRIDSCNECGSQLTHHLDKPIIFRYAGETIPIGGSEGIKMKVNKKVITEITVRVYGAECSNGHKYYIDKTIKVRHVCPLCSSTMKNYGFDLKTCLRCHTHVPSKAYMEVDTSRILEDNGWKPYTELL